MNCEWDERRLTTDDSICIVADFTKDEYLERIMKLIKEQLTVFPELDYLFFEFEGLKLEMFTKVYSEWAQKNGGPSPEQVSYNPAIRKHCKAIGIESNLFWSYEGRELLSNCFRYIFMKYKIL